MRHKSSTPETPSNQSPSERLVRDIRRATRKQYSAEEKIRIVLGGLRGDATIAVSVIYKGFDNLHGSENGSASTRRICSAWSSAFASPAQPDARFRDGFLCSHAWTGEIQKFFRRIRAYVPCCVTLEFETSIFVFASWWSGIFRADRRSCCPDPPTAPTIWSLLSL